MNLQNCVRKHTLPVQIADYPRAKVFKISCFCKPKGGFQKARQMFLKFYVALVSEYSESCGVNIMVKKTVLLRIVPHITSTKNIS